MMQITSLRDFENREENRRFPTVGFVDGLAKYESLSADVDIHFRDHPDANVGPDMLATRESGHGNVIGARDIFLPVRESALKKVASVWHEKGFVEAVYAIAEENPEEVTRTLHWVASRLKRMFEVVEKVATRNEGPSSTGSDTVQEVAATRDWATAIVRCLAWHPHCTRLALATRDDRIRVFSKDVQGVAVLRHGFQKSVSCLSWRPNAGRELAVACRSGVLIWTVELGAASSSLSQAATLQQRGHAPVTNVAWHPQGDLLVSCSPADNNLYIWDVAKESGVPLKRVGGGGLCLARWSHCGTRLLAANSRTVFRVWSEGNEGKNWKSEKWTVPNGRLAAACFGPKLSLLFASTEDPATVFTLPLQENVFDVEHTSGSGDDVRAAVPLIDLTKIHLNLGNDDDDSGYFAGGRIASMDWDPLGKYLAVIFQESPVVVLFETRLRPASRITEAAKGCFIRGFPGEAPNCMHFQQNFKEKADRACLTIAWSSGRVQHFAIVGRNAVSNISSSPTSNFSTMNAAQYNFHDNYYTY